MTQAQLGARVGLSQTTVSRNERGFGGGTTLDTWQRLFTALGRRFVVEVARDPMEEPADAGHLGLQELVLRLGRLAGYDRSFELQLRPVDRARSTDVGLRDDRRRRLVLVESWNSFGNLGAGVRSSASKVAEAEALAIAVGGDRPHRVSSCWVVRATLANRALVARYPEIFATAFMGSSRSWVAALTSGTEPPSARGLVWADVATTRLFAWRRS